MFANKKILKFLNDCDHARFLDIDLKLKFEIITIILNQN